MREWFARAFLLHFRNKYFHVLELLLTTYQKNRRKLFKLNILWEMKKVEESFE